MEYRTLSARIVADAMHSGVITCAPAAPLREVARTMARFRVHAIAVEGEGGGVLGVVSDSDLVAAIDGGDVDSVTAGDVAQVPPVTVRRDDTLRHAAHLLRANGATHAVVVDPGTGRAVGILSTLDLVHAVAAEPVP